MKLRNAALIALVLCLLMVARVDASSVWIYGAVTLNPTSITYGLTVYSYGFNVSSSSDPSIQGSLTVVSLFEPQQDRNYNFSGYFVLDNSSGLPIGVFYATSINEVSNGSSNGLTDTAKSIWSSLAAVGNLFVTLMIQAVQVTTGYQLSQLLGGVLVILVLGAFFLFFSKRMPWYMDLLGFIVIAAVISNLLSSL
jgi:hypothetical protein